MRRLLPPVLLIAATFVALWLAPAPGGAPAAQAQEGTPTPEGTPGVVVLDPVESPSATPTATSTPEQTLSVRPVRRSVSRAALDGFRVQTTCGGGCLRMRVRVFISPLTARQHRIRKPDGSRYTEEVVIGNAPTVRDAEGERRVSVLIKGSYGRKLADARTLRIAVEAEVTDAGSFVRTAVRVLTLRR